MKKVLNDNSMAGSRKSSEPRLVGSIAREVLQGWKPNTELSVDLKTLLRNDVRMVTGKDYHGVLRRDEEIDEFLCEEHYTFFETMPQKDGKRNPHVFEGEFITATRRDDGSPRLNFKKLKMGEGFNLEHYALGVYNEICMALVAW